MSILLILFTFCFTGCNWGIVPDRADKYLNWLRRDIVLYSYDIVPLKLTNGDKTISNNILDEYSSSSGMDSINFGKNGKNTKPNVDKDKEDSDNTGEEDIDNNEEKDTDNTEEGGTSKPDKEDEPHNPTKPTP